MSWTSNMCNLTSKLGIEYVDVTLILTNILNQFIIWNELFLLHNISFFSFDCSGLTYKYDSKTNVLQSWYFFHSCILSIIAWNVKTQEDIATNLDLKYMFCHTLLSCAFNIKGRDDFYRFSSLSLSLVRVRQKRNRRRSAILRISYRYAI